MSGIFNQLMTQEAEKQRQAIQKVKEQNDADSTSDATASQQDATTSQPNKDASLPKQRTQAKAAITATVLDEKLMGEIIAELSRAEVLPNALSIRMSAEEKQYVDDFILDTLRKEKLHGPEVSIAKLMRYALAYLLLNHQAEFIDVLKKALLKKDSGRLFQ